MTHLNDNFQELTQRYRLVRLRFMLPNINIKPYVVTESFSIDPFWTLVSLSVILCFFISRARIKKLGLNPKVYDGSASWILCFGFIVAHLVTALFYYPQVVKENPLILLDIFNGLSSFGGFLGAVFGATIYFRIMKIPMLPYVEGTLFGFVPAWVIARLGCTITFDHPGLPSSFFLAMQDMQGVARHNLGLYEMLLAIILTAFLFLTRKRSPFIGFHTSIIMMSFAVIRFGFDFLRVADVTYAGLTPGQYIAILLFVGGIFIYFKNSIPKSIT